MTVDVQFEDFGRIFWTHVARCPACLVSCMGAVMQKPNGMLLIDFAKAYCCKIAVELVEGQLKIETAKKAGPAA